MPVDISLLVADDTPALVRRHTPLMPRTMLFWVTSLFVGCTSPDGRKLPCPDHLVYSSSNLAGHAVAAEMLGESNCSESDVSVKSLPDYGEVASNIGRRDVYVNAIGHKTFVETLPSGDKLDLGMYRYAVSVQLPLLPKADVRQASNPQAVHTMIQLWDGRNALWQADKTALEGAIYWDLNPWTSTEYGKIKVYTKSLQLIDTGVTLLPDTAWHKFVLVVDLRRKRYVSISVDGQTRDLGDVPLAEVKHTDWGQDVTLVITTESLAAWPSNSDHFTWTTRFKDIRLTH